MQWIVPRPDDGSLAVVWAPVWADKLTARDGTVLRRRGAPLVSRWLSGALCMAGADGGAGASDAPLKHGKRPLAAVFAFAVDADERRPLLPHHADDVRFAATLSELVRVVADLSEAAGLPATQLVPTPERTGLELSIGALGTMSGAQLADALLLLRAAVESSLLARGLVLTDARVRVDDETHAVDGKLHGRLGKP